MKLRYWFRLIKTFFYRFRGIVFIGIIVGLLIFSAARFLFPYFLPAELTVSGRSGRYHTEDLPLDIITLIGEGLTNVDSSGEVYPGLASSWTESEDGTVWTFKIDTQKVWHDGTKVLSSDINYEFQDATIERPDEETIVFRLNTPFSPFPLVVSRPTFKRGLLGTGDWRVTDIDLANEYIEKLVLVNDNNEKHVIRFYPTEEAVKTAFQLGEIDEIEDLLDPYPFNEWDTIQVQQIVDNDRFVAVFFNNESEIFAGNKQLRQALSYAIDKNDFNAPRALGPISPESWAYNPQIKDYAYDTKRAIELLDEIPSEMRENLSFTLTTSPVLLTTAEKIANYWREIGVNVNVNVVSVLPEQYDAFLAIYNIPRDPDQYSMWHGSQLSTNLSKLSNRRINLLLEEGRLELDQQERKRIYLDFQRFLLEEAPAVFLYHPYSFRIVRK